MVFNESKTGFEKEPVSKDSDTEYVQLECSNENHGESSHEEGEQESTQQEIPDVILRHSTRERKVPDYYGNRVTVADTSGDPKSWKEAMASTRPEPIMLFKLPIMLLSIAPKNYLLCFNYASSCPIMLHYAP